MGVFRPHKSKQKEERGGVGGRTSEPSSSLPLLPLPLPLPLSDPSSSLLASLWSLPDSSDSAPESTASASPAFLRAFLFSSYTFATFSSNS